MPHTQQAHIHTYISNNFWTLDLWTQTYPKGTLVNLHNHWNRVIILFAKEYEFVYTAEPRTTKIHVSYTWIFIHSFALYMHTCITCMHVCTCACDCSGSLIMALQGLKHESFKIDYWELPIDTVFCWLIYILKKKINFRINNVVHYWLPYS